ncbi:MAG: hypothetical protein QM820_16985 [Minicystis sp.]
MQRFLFASTVAAVLSTSVAARAEFATPPGDVAVILPQPAPVAVPAPRADVARVAKAPEDHLWISARFEGGASFLPSGAPGGYGRVAVEMLSTGDSVRDTGPVLGFWYGVEGWGAPKVGGGGVPLLFEAGVKTTHFVGTLGAGFNILNIDKIGEKYGVGVFSPRASVRLGLHFEPVYLVATADVQRRWQWGLDDMTVMQTGLAVGFMLDGSKPAKTTASASTWR